uniref:Nidogen 1a n=1 Tax=Cyprinus carpio TaxID=7962 RepID=A0A8C1RK96_CYPCA
MGRQGQRWPVWILLLGLSVCVSGITREELFPFGRNAGDRALDEGSDETQEISLQKPVTFYSGQFSQIYVSINTNGFVALEKPAGESEYLGNMPAGFGMIAALQGDLDTSDGEGKVFFRQDSSPALLQQAADHINRAFPEDDVVNPISAVVVTWVDVASHRTESRGDGPEPSGRRNTFQLVIASLETQSYAILLYPREAMQFQSTSSYTMHAGFSKGQDKYFSSKQAPYYRITDDTEASVRNLAEMNGKVSGRVVVGNSQVPVDFASNDLHSYVVVNDGRAYVAISAIPPIVGFSLQPLSSVGGIIGWAFALQQPGFKNGFSIIGGVFRRQAEVTFQPGGERLTISQEFKGIDEHDHLMVDTRLEGKIPELPQGATVQIEPYTEIYQYSTNLITASSTREYVINLQDQSTQSRSFKFRETITFEGCQHDEVVRALPSTQMLSVDQVFVMYDRGEELLRYAMTNKIGDVNGGQTEENPCFTGRHGCDTNAVCRPGQGNQFTCECAAGFTGDGRACNDIDECRETPQICGPNAVCNNQPGTFRCECQEGFQFASDGQTCVEVQRPVDPCRIGTHDCDVPERARCSYTGGSSYICTCLPGFMGDGRSCQEYEKTRCQLHRESVLGAGPRGPRPVPGQYVPTCDAQGEYDPMQCHASAGQCWCVDRNGLEISGTRTGPGRFPECPGHDVPRPIGPTPDPNISPLPPGSHILFAQSGKIEYIPLEGHNLKKNEAKTALHLPEKVVIGIAYDCVEKMVYWTDISTPAISRASLQGGEPVHIIKSDLSSPEGIAIDHLGRNVFWTDSMKDRIEVSSLDGSQRRVLINTDLVNPRAILTDPTNGYIYWADWNRDAPKIEMAYMDGTNRRVLAKDGLGLPNGLTYDPQTSLLCWADAGTSQLFECLGGKTTDSGVFLTVCVFVLIRGAVIVVDRHARREVDEFQPQKRTRLYGITTAHAHCPSGQNYCSSNNGGCTHFCLATPAGRSCRCPDNAAGLGCVEREGWN